MAELGSGVRGRETDLTCMFETYQLDRFDKYQLTSITFFEHSNFWAEQL